MEHPGLAAGTQCGVEGERDGERERGTERRGGAGVPARTPGARPARPGPAGRPSRSLTSSAPAAAGPRGPPACPACSALPPLPPPPSRLGTAPSPPHRRTWPPWRLSTAPPDGACAPALATPPRRHALPSRPRTGGHAPGPPASGPPRNRDRWEPGTRGTAGQLGSGSRLSLLPGGAGRTLPGRSSSLGLVAARDPQDTSGNRRLDFQNPGGF